MTFTDCLHMNWKLNISQPLTRTFYYGNNEFKIVFHPKICGSILYIFLYGKNCNKYKVRVHLVDNSENPVFEKSFEGSLNCGPVVWSFDREKLIPRDDILCNEIATFIISIATCETIPIPYAEKKTSLTRKDEVTLQTLSQDYSKLFNNTENSDVVLQCGELKISAHRIILSARSDMFADMFENYTVEGKNGPVNIDDIDPAILEKLIRYIYSGKVDDLSMETAIQLYEAAHIYAVEQLKHHCVLYMVENLSNDCACDVFLLADTHSDTHLKDSVESFMVKSKEFLLSDMWYIFSQNHPLLAINVYKKFSKPFLTQDSILKMLSDKNEISVQFL